MYATDNRGIIPYAGNFTHTNGRWWTHALKDGEYLVWEEKAVTCPSLPYPGNWKTSDYNTYGAARLTNRTGEIKIRGRNWFFGIDTLFIESPSEFFYFADSAKRQKGKSFTQWVNFIYTSGATMRPHSRHFQAANLWFIDGHAATHKLGSLRKMGIDYIWTENFTALSP